MGISTHAAQLLVGDSLELRGRLPRLWARIQDLTLQAWRGRQIAERTRDLSQEAAGWVDAQVAPFAHKIGLKPIPGPRRGRADPVRPRGRREESRSRRRTAQGVGQRPEH
ncbi:MAG TPA: hypothetical protein VFD59_10175 [Nocardioidaceae bacterium]|nr:hypothetical protein [Nocardioidaceae bacterium]